MEKVITLSKSQEKPSRGGLRKRSIKDIMASLDGKIVDGKIVLNKEDAEEVFDALRASSPIRKKVVKAQNEKNKKEEEAKENIPYAETRRGMFERTPRGAARKARYNAKDETPNFNETKTVKNSKADYEKSDRAKERRQRYHKSDKGKARKKRELVQRKKVNAEFKGVKDLMKAGMCICKKDTICKEHEAVVLQVKTALKIE